MLLNQLVFVNLIKGDDKTHNIMSRIICFQVYYNGSLTNIQVFLVREANIRNYGQRPIYKHNGIVLKFTSLGGGKIHTIHTLLRMEKNSYSTKK